MPLRPTLYILECDKNWHKESSCFPNFARSACRTPPIACADFPRASSCSTASTLAGKIDFTDETLGVVLLPKSEQQSGLCIRARGRILSQSNDSDIRGHVESPPEYHDPFPPEKRAQVFAAIKKLREGSHPPPLGRCMFWDEACGDPPIGSHSLSKCWLETIMFEGHVAKMALSMEKDANGRLQPTGHIDLIGWNEASVFQGFCNKHDTELFLNLDSLDVTPTIDDCMRLVYRSVCREAAGKHRIVSVFHAQGMTADERGMQNVLPEVGFGLRLFKYKFEVEAVLASGDYSDFDHLVFDMNSRPHLLGTTTFMPLATSRGKVLGPNLELIDPDR